MNWVAVRYRLKRSRRAQLVLFFLLLALATVAAQLVQQALNPDAGRPSSGETGPIQTGRVDVALAVPRWQVGDFWVWEDDLGTRITDRVVDTDTIGTSLVYRVRRESSSVDGRAPRVENLTFDALTLAVRRAEYPGLNVEWQQRTMGLTHTSRSFGFSSNATATLATGERYSFTRVANVTGMLHMPIDTPVGSFANVTYIQGEYRDYNLHNAERSRAVVLSRWFAAEVGNDVGFRLPNGTVMWLVGYRYEGLGVPAPPMKEVPTWRPGLSWTYELGDTRRTFSVVSVERGHVRVEDRLGALVDVRHYRASDLALVNFTLYTGLFEISPAGVPLAPRGPLTVEYVKRVHAAGGPYDFVGTASVRAAPGAVLPVRAGTFDVWRIDTEEKETDPDGKQHTVRTVRFYSDEVGNDVRFMDLDGRTWSLRSFRAPPAGYRFDSLPPPL